MSLRGVLRRSNLMEYPITEIATPSARNDTGARNEKFKNKSCLLLSEFSKGKG